MKDKKINFLSELSGLKPEKVVKGFKRDIIKEHKNHYRLNKRYAGTKKGTCIFKNRVIIPGFPKIRRAMMISPTIENRFGDKIAIEEKMNGYNVRIAKINNKIFGLTRSGLICPYTTNKARKKINEDFFENNPQKYLCGEMVGPNNPYVPTDVYDVESLDFFVFDIRKRGSGQKLTIKNRRKICDKFNLNKINLIDVIETKNCFKKIKKIIKKLGGKQKEGIVIKDPQTDLEPIKYTTSQSNCQDLEFAYEFYHDYGNDFVYSRTVREGFQSYEWDEEGFETKERAKRLGMSILEPMKKTINKRENGEKITETVQIKVKELSLAKKFLSHLSSQGVVSEVVEIKEKENDFIVIIEKLQESTNDKTKQLIEGGVW